MFSHVSLESLKAKDNKRRHEIQTKEPNVFITIVCRNVSVAKNNKSL